MNGKAIAASIPRAVLEVRYYVKTAPPVPDWVDLVDGSGLWLHRVFAKVDSIPPRMSISIAVGGSSEYNVSLYIVRHSSEEELQLWYGDADFVSIMEFSRSADAC